MPFASRPDALSPHRLRWIFFGSTTLPPGRGQFLTRGNANEPFRGLPGIFGRGCYGSHLPALLVRQCLAAGWDLNLTDGEKALQAVVVRGDQVPNQTRFRLTLNRRSSRRACAFKSSCGRSPLRRAPSVCAIQRRGHSAGDQRDGAICLPQDNRFFDWAEMAFDGRDETLRSHAQRGRDNPRIGRCAADLHQPVSLCGYRT